MASQPKTTVTQQNDAQISMKEVYTLLDPLERFQFIRGKYFKFEFLKIFTANAACPIHCSRIIINILIVFFLVLLLCFSSNNYGALKHPEPKDRFCVRAPVVQFYAQLLDTIRKYLHKSCFLIHSKQLKATVGAMI